jgi:DNA-binding NtrC family response regulator
MGQFGPGEYELILVDLAPAAAEHAVERLAQALAARWPDVRIGSARYPRDGRDPHSLLARARARCIGETEDVATPSPLAAVEGAMQSLRRLVSHVSTGTISVLILGETGVGKEVVAETIHRSSPRSARAFLRLNCAALSESLLESELFGHERGAFTGAVAAKPGLMESADGGTVFLDEVGEMPLSTQAKLLRVIERREVLRVGALTPRPIDVRFISATNRDPEEEIARKAFRQDLYFRLNGVTLVIPPLRHRTDEIIPIAEQFIRQFCAEAHRPQLPLSREAAALLERYSWPGNIRELRNVIERAVLLCREEVVLPAHLPLDKMRAQTLASVQVPVPSPLSPATPVSTPILAAPSTPPAAPVGELSDELQALERQRIIEALARCAGNQTHAAELLGMSRRTLVSKLARFDIPRPRKKRES